MRLIFSVSIFPKLIMNSDRQIKLQHIFRYRETFLFEIRSAFAIVLDHSVVDHL
jgi:hypothetical protein